MPVDTADKRASCLGINGHSRQVFPIPDGGFNQGDRQQIAVSYRGILAGGAAAAAAAVGGVMTAVWGRRRVS